MALASNPAPQSPVFPNLGPEALSKHEMDVIGVLPHVVSDKMASWANEKNPFGYIAFEPS
jgi:hypothetical protein